MICLALHWSNTSVLNNSTEITSVQLTNPDITASSPCTHREEQPLKLLAVSFRVLNGIMRELILLVKVLGKVDEDRGGLKDREPFVRDGGDASVGVDLKEPRRLDLIVDLANVRVANAHSDFSTRDRLTFNV